MSLQIVEMRWRKIAARTLSLLGFLSEHCQCPFECLAGAELNAQSRGHLLVQVTSGSCIQVELMSNSPVLKSLLSAKVVDSLWIIPLLELNPTLKIKNMSLLGLSIPCFQSYCLEAQVS